MQCIRFSIVIMFSILVSVGAHAQPLPDNVGSELLPPPPGPYLSSRQRLAQSPLPTGGDNRLPFDGTMPSPMRYLPSPNQPPYPPVWWGNPVGR